MKTTFAGVVALLALLGCPSAHAEVVTRTAAAGPADAIVPGAKIAPEPAARADVGTGGAVPLSVALAVAKELAVPPLPPPITLTLKVDLRAQRLTVLERGAVLHVWSISSGRAGYATQTGTFQPQWTSKMWYSRQWDMAPMPHAVFFNKGTAFHATQAVGALGRPASHGCIRLSPANAAKLYAKVHRHRLVSTKVIVDGAAKEPAVARRNGVGQKDWQAQRAPGVYYAADGYQTGPRPQRGARPSSSIWGF